MTEKFKNYFNIFACGRNILYRLDVSYQRALMATPKDTGVARIYVPYIHYLYCRVPEAYELWALAEDGVREVHPYARIKILSDFREDTFHTHSFNARRSQIPFLGHRSGNMSVEFIDVVRTTQHVRSRVTSWTKNIFVHFWGPYPTMIPSTISTITRRAYNVPVTFHGLVLRSNHERLRLKHVESRRICVEELLARIRQYICDKVRAEWGAALFTPGVPILI